MKLWVLWALLPVLPAAPLRAEILSLDPLLKEAEANNPAVLARRERWEAARLNAKAAGTLPNPTLGIAAMPVKLQTRGGPVNGKASLSQALPFWGKRGLQEEAAKGDAGAAEAAYRAKVLEVRAETAAAYYDIEFLSRAGKIYSEQADLLRHFSRIAEKKYSTGKGSQAMVFRAQAELSRMQNEVFTATQREKAVRARLAALLGRDASSVEGELPESAKPVWSFDDATIESRASAQRPELLALRALEGRSEAERRLAIKRWFPDFSVGYEWTSIGAGTTHTSFDGKDAQAVSVGLTLPLWFGANRARSGGAGAARRAAAFEASALEKDTRADLASMIVDAKTFLELYRVDEDTVLPQVRSAVKATLSGYQSDSASFVDLLDAERAQLQTELAHAMHKSMFWKTIARLERVVGGPL